MAVSVRGMAGFTARLGRGTRGALASPLEFTLRFLNQKERAILASTNRAAGIDLSLARVDERSALRAALGSVPSASWARMAARCATRFGDEVTSG